MKRFIFIISVIFILFFSFGEILIPQSGSGRFRNIKKWKGEIHYKRNYKESLSDNRVSFLKLKGLSGDTSETISIDGHVTFKQLINKDTNKKYNDLIFSSSGNNILYVGKGKVKYSVSTIVVSKLGEAMVVHLTSGKGKEKIVPVKYINYLRFDFSDGTYSMSITPGIEDDELNAFGVYVESVSEMKITRALLNKMEEHNRKIPFPELLKKMFPDVIKNPDRESIAAEAFGIAFPTSGYTLKGSYKDEKGGIFSWKLTPLK